MTSIRGTWHFGLGEDFDPSRLHELTTGRYASAPAGSSMFGYSSGGAIVQIHGVRSMLRHRRTARD